MQALRTLSVRSFYRQKIFVGILDHENIFYGKFYNTKFSRSTVLFSLPLAMTYTDPLPFLSSGEGFWLFGRQVDNNYYQVATCSLHFVPQALYKSGRPYG